MHSLPRAPTSHLSDLSSDLSLPSRLKSHCGGPGPGPGLLGARDGDHLLGSGPGATHGFCAQKGALKWKKAAEGFGFFGFFGFGFNEGKSYRRDISIRILLRFQTQHFATWCPASDADLRAAGLAHLLDGRPALALGCSQPQSQVPADH